MRSESHPRLHTVKSNKPLGAYLIEAGLLNEAQVGVALADQTSTSMTFGEIVVTRGWVKEQTIEYLMKKVILPERSATKTIQSKLAEGLARQRPLSTQQSDLNLASVRKPPTTLHNVNSKATTPPQAPLEEGVNWIG